MTDNEIIKALDDALERRIKLVESQQKTTKSKAIREFAEKLKEYSIGIVLYGEVVTISQIDNLVKEMTEEISND